MNRRRFDTDFKSSSSSGVCYNYPEYYRNIPVNPFRWTGNVIYNVHVILYDKQPIIFIQTSKHTFTYTQLHKHIQKYTYKHTNTNTTSQNARYYA